MPVQTRSTAATLARFTVSELEAAAALLELRKATLTPEEMRQLQERQQRPRRAAAARAYTSGTYKE